MKLTFYISIIITLITLNVNAQETEIKAIVSKNKLGLNEQLRVEYTLNKIVEIDSFIAPNFKNFIIVAGPHQGTSQSWENGRYASSKSFEYIIKPKQKGEFNLPSVSIELNGKILSSKPVKIDVTDAVDLSKNPNDPNYIAQQNIHLVSKVSNLRPKVGEKITIEYSIYANKIINLNKVILPVIIDDKKPNIKVIDMKETNMKDTVFDKSGKKYRYTIFRKIEITPRKVGRFYIDPYEIKIHATVPNGKFDYFSNPMYDYVYDFFTTDKKEINVRK